MRNNFSELEAQTFLLSHGAPPPSSNTFSTPASHCIGEWARLPEGHAVKAAMTRPETKLRRKTSARSGGLFGTFLANVSLMSPCLTTQVEWVL